MTSETDLAGVIASLETRVRRLEDVEGVLQLLLDYRRHVDARDFDAYSRLFADDGVWSGSLGTATGPAEIKALLDRTLDIYPDDSTREYHLVANPEITVDGDRATAESTFCFISRGDGDTPVLSLVGHYQDVLIRGDDRWRFLHRNAVLDIPYGIDPNLPTTR